MTELHEALPWASLEHAIPRLPRSRAGLEARLRALSAARLAVAIFLGGGGHIVTTDAGDSRGRHRPPIAIDGAAAA